MIIQKTKNAELVGPIQHFLFHDPKITYGIDRSCKFSFIQEKSFALSSCN